MNQKDKETQPDLQREKQRLWTPFPELNWVRGGISLRSAGGMSWDNFPVNEVSQNRELYFEQLGVNIGLGVGADQVHGTHVHSASKADLGRGMKSPTDRIPDCDGFVTCESGVVLTTLHADCAPVFFVNVETKCIGLAHCGWRGTSQGLAGTMLKRLARASQAQARAVQVVIGPMISTWNYEFGSSDADVVARRFGQAVIMKAAGKTFFDLYSAIVIDLLESGLNPSTIPQRPPCTFANSCYASFRRDGRPTRSMLAWLVREN